MSIKEGNENNEKILHFAEQEITDRTQTAIAILVGIFGILLLFADIERDKHVGILTLLTLSFVYGGLSFVGWIFLVQRQTFIVLKEDLVWKLSPSYNSRVKEISQEGGWVTRLSFRRTIREATKQENNKDRTTPKKYWTSSDVWNLRVPAISYPIACFLLWLFIAIYHW